MIELRRLGCRFGDFALRDISLSIRDGEYWVILGPSGCGKSVLLQTMAGFHSPTGGSIHIDGRDVTGVAPERRNMGLVFQQAALFPHKSVRDNIGYGLRVRRAPEREVEGAVKDLVQRLRLEAIVSRPVATLSGGEAQRIAVARALAIKPNVLLLDEPMSALDHNTRLELQTELRRVHGELRLTTLHVTHSREEAAAMGTHIAVMLTGRIVQQGTLAEVLARPRCPFVARFLGLDPSTITDFPACASRCGEKPGECTSDEAS